MLVLQFYAMRTIHLPAKQKATDNPGIDMFFSRLGISIAIPPTQRHHIQIGDDLTLKTTDI